MRKVIFLPGAGGSPEFWEPVGSHLPKTWSKLYFAWPGLGEQPSDPSINGIDDLARLVLTRTEGHFDIVAQSLGGVVAAKVALAEPARVRGLVLTVTSGGLDMEAFGGADWRPEYRRTFPGAAEWITRRGSIPNLPLERISAPTLLLWGDADLISPVAVGRHLQARLPNARLQIISGGDHDLAVKRAEAVACLIVKHLESVPQSI